MDETMKQLLIKCVTALAVSYCMIGGSASNLLAQPTVVDETIRVDSKLPPAVTSTSATKNTATVGSAAYYYWVVTVFSDGTMLAPSGAARISNIPPPSGGASVTVRWNPVAGATSYTLLRLPATRGSSFPGSCTSCVVAAGIVGTSQADIGAALGAFTMTPRLRRSGTITLDRATGDWVFTPATSNLGGGISVPSGIAIPAACDLNTTPFFMKTDNAAGAMLYTCNGSPGTYDQQQIPWTAVAGAGISIVCAGAPVTTCTITNSAPATSSFDPMNPNIETFVYPTGNRNAAQAPNGWLLTAVGGATCANFGDTVAAAGDQFSYWRFEQSSNNAAHACFVTSASNTSFYGDLTSAATYRAFNFYARTASWAFWGPGNHLKFGLYSGIVVDPDGVFIRLDNLGNFFCVVRSGGADLAAVDTGVTAVVSTAYDLTVKSTTSGIATCTVNGTTVNTGAVVFPATASWGISTHLTGGAWNIRELRTQVTRQ